MPEEGAKNVSWVWLFPLSVWGSLTMAFTDKFVSMAQNFTLLHLNPFDLRVNRGDGDLSTVSHICGFACQQWVFKTFTWPWLSLLQGWGVLTMTFTGKFVYMAHHFILLRLNAFYLRVDVEEWWFEDFLS